MSKQKKTAGVAQERLEAFQAKQQLEAAKAKRRKSDNRVALLIGSGAIVVAVLAQLAYFSFGPGAIDETAPEQQTENSELVPSPELAEARAWSGSMQVGDAALELELDGVNAPQAVANFLSLSRSGFFEGVSCHRLTTEGIFVLQCGDPDGNGTGGPGYEFGPIENAPADNVYPAGTLAMARPPFQEGLGPRMGSQFFIVYSDSTLSSDQAGGYTVFGKITSGLEGLDPIISAGVEGGATDGAPAIETLLGTIELR